MQSELYCREVRRLHLAQRSILGENPGDPFTYDHVALAFRKAANGWSTTYGSADPRNVKQTYRVNMKQVVGEEWNHQYRYYGMKLETLVWNYRQSLAPISNDLLSLKIGGLSFVRMYDVAAKNCLPQQTLLTLDDRLLGSDKIVATVLPEGGSPILYFEIMDGQEWVDITLQYVKTANGAPLVDADFSSTTSSGTKSLALPEASYLFHIWPVLPQKRLIELNGFPVQKSKVRGYVDPSSN